MSGHAEALPAGFRRHLIVYSIHFALDKKIELFYLADYPGEFIVKIGTPANRPFSGERMGFECFFPICQFL